MIRSKFNAVFLAAKALARESVSRVLPSNFPTSSVTVIYKKEKKRKKKKGGNLYCQKKKRKKTNITILQQKQQQQQKLTGHHIIKSFTNSGKQFVRLHIG